MVLRGVAQCVVTHAGLGEIGRCVLAFIESKATTRTEFNLGRHRYGCRNGASVFGALIRASRRNCAIPSFREVKSCANSVGQPFM
jgi:hypothetical protein